MRQTHAPNHSSTTRYSAKKLPTTTDLDRSFPHGLHGAAPELALSCRPRRRPSRSPTSECLADASCFNHLDHQQRFFTAGLLYRLTEVISLHGGLGAVWIPAAYDDKLAPSAVATADAQTRLGGRLFGYVGLRAGAYGEAGALASNLGLYFGTRWR